LPFVGAPAFAFFEMIGIYGGTFDPVHYGHLRTALEVKEALGLEQIRLLPCRQPPHRGVPGATPEQRLSMLKLALAEAEPGFMVDTRELERAGPSYMIDTLTTLRAECGTAPLCLVIGMDAFLGLHHWHRWRELIKQAHLAIMRRPGSHHPIVPDELAAWVSERSRVETACLRAQPAGFIHFIEVTQLAISATRIRELVRAGRSARYLLPDAVLHYMRANGLYGM